MPLRRATTDDVDGYRTDTEVGSAAEWDRLVTDAGGGLAQTWDWGELKRQSNWSPIRIGVRERGRLIGGAQILVRRVNGFGSIGYIDGGPLAIIEGSSIREVLLDLIAATCRAHRARALIVDPPEDTIFDRSTFEAAGYLASQVKTSLGATVRVDLRRPEEELLAAMKSKTRYNVRKGQRSGVEVRVGTAADIPRLHTLLSSTAERQGFVAPSVEYLTEMWQRLAPLGRVSTFLADVEGETVAGILVTALGDTATYKRGAWDGRHGNAHPNEVLHWEAMRWARDSGFAWYDFDGIEREVAETLMAGDDPGELETVTRFKLGFGGDAVLLPRSVTMVPSRLLRIGYRYALPRLLRIRRFKILLRNLRSR